MATNKKNNNNNYEKVKKPKKETILIEMTNDIVIDYNEGKTLINGFEFIEKVFQYGKGYAKCINKK